MSLLAKIEDVLPGLMREYKATGGFTNWHGGPHKFDRFDYSKINTGQGAQSFGHGLYTADFKPVAVDYRDTLAKEQPSFKHPSYGVISPSKLSEYLASVGIAADPKRIGKLKGMQMGAEVAKVARSGPAAIEGLAQRVAKGSYPDQQAWQEIVEAAKPFELVPNAGHLYETKIKGHPVEDFVYQNRPTSAQSDKVREALGNLGVPVTDDFARHRMLAEDNLRMVQRDTGLGDAGVRQALNEVREANTYPELRDAYMRAEKSVHELPWDYQDNYLQLLSTLKKGANKAPGAGYDTGRGAYEQLANRKGGYAKASAALREQGILGMRYPDAGSRGVGQGTYNTISFSDDVIEIVKRYGVAALVAAGVISEEMARALQQQGIDKTFEEEPVA